MAIHFSNLKVPKCEVFSSRMLSFWLINFDILIFVYLRRNSPLKYINFDTSKTAP